jgi:hypothetical protein
LRLPLITLRYANSLPQWTLLRAAGLLVLLLLPAAVAQDDSEERGRLAAAIRSRVHAIEAARKRHLADRASLQQETERLDAAVAALAEQRDRSAEEVSELRQRLAQARTELQQRRAASGRELAAVRSWARAARPVALRLAEGIRAGIPHQRSVRAKAFEEAAALLGAESGDGKREAEGLQRFLTAVAQEMQLAATREVKSETVALDAEVSKYAYVARFGLVNEVFVTEDGTHAGIASRDAASPWRVMRDPADVEAITAILDCVRKRRAPELVAVPFALGREH